MEDSRLLQSQITSCPSTPTVANLDTFSRDPVCSRISEMAFWWVESSSTSLPPALARLSRPLNLSMALKKKGGWKGKSVMDEEQASKTH